jgi:phosphoglycerate dehydrogenase-like enzyme
LKNKHLNKLKVAVTSKTFSEDEYLVSELTRYFNEVKINNTKDNLAGESLIDFLSDCNGMILGTEMLDAKVINSLPNMRYVSKYGVGLNNIDFEALKRNGIQFTYKKDVNSDSVAELVLGYTINMVRRVDSSMCGYKTGKWSKLPGKELPEMTLGIIGYGYIGKVVAQKFEALGIGRLLVNDLLDFPEASSCEFVSLDYLLSESDVVTLHIDAEKRNYNFVNEKFINKMKTGAYLINTSRGTILDEFALVKALKSEKLAGAALDVYKEEPNINKKLCSCPNLLTTCHIAGSSNRAIKEMGLAAIEGLVKLFNIDSV